MRLIDADALLKELKKSCEYHAENSRELSLLQRDIIIVQERPTVDAVPVRHGKWIDITDSHIGTCSLCGDRWGSVDMMNYCPSCGARMDAK